MSVLGFWIIICMYIYLHCVRVGCEAYIPTNIKSFGSGLHCIVININLEVWNIGCTLRFFLSFGRFNGNNSTNFNGSFNTSICH